MASEPRKDGHFHCIPCNRSGLILSCFQRSFGHPHAHLTATSVLHPQRICIPFFALPFLGVALPLTCSPRQEFVTSLPLPSLAKSAFSPQYPLKTISLPLCSMAASSSVSPLGHKALLARLSLLQIYFSRGHLSMPKT